MVTVVIVTIGLLILLEGAASWIWTPQIKTFPSAFPTRGIHVGGVTFSLQDLGTLAVTIGAVIVLWAFFQFTKVGLGMRAAALRPGPARLMGVRVGWTLALGWGLAAVLGAIAGLMIAPEVFLQPTMMDTILIYAFAAAVVGGIESPAGAVVGGLGLGVLLEPARELRALRDGVAAAARRPRAAARGARDPADGALRPARWCGAYEDARAPSPRDRGRGGRDRAAAEPSVRLPPARSEARSRSSSSRSSGSTS